MGASSSRVHNSDGLPQYGCVPNYVRNKAMLDHRGFIGSQRWAWSGTQAWEATPLDQCQLEVRASPKHYSKRSFDVEVKGPNGAVQLRTSRTLVDFAETHNQLRHEFPTAAPATFLGGLGSGCAGRSSATGAATSVGCGPFVRCGTAPEPQEATPEHCFAWERQLSEGTTVAGLQQWLNQVSGAGLLKCSSPLQSLLGFPGPANLWAAPGVPSLGMIIECNQPLLLEIAQYLADAPYDFAAFCGMASKTVVMQLQFAEQSLWRDIYTRRWAAFAECATYQGVEDWRGLYRETLAGRWECTLEVFDREKKLGFAMAAMAARVQYEASACGYVARYLSASEVLPETIPGHESHRLRFCPLSARPQLQPALSQASGASDMRLDSSPCSGKSNKEGSPPYPYRVLQGTEGLRVGMGVELQWKMQFGSPFGWWYGTLEELHKDPSGETARATITFRHFPATSRWYRLEVKFGDDDLRPCTFGGYTGGIRPVSEDENKHWMHFFPKEPVVF
mmetsp:Transcript_82787/g.208430  ORF Transcript_82787/g.208430 Transcript_82787/m.208430 type:complete len:505 (+) Transcript_82787:100-1614(+)